jgi:tetratricopeptide (TPR) repeat protein
MFRFTRLIQLLPFFFLLMSFLDMRGQSTRSTASPQLALSKVRQLFSEGQYQTAAIFSENYLSSHEAKGLVKNNEAEEFAYIRIAAGIIQHEATAIVMATAMINKAENRSISVKLAYHLGHHYFSLAMYPEAIRFLEMTDKLYLSREEGQRVAFEKGVSYFSQKKFDNAKPYFKQLLDVESSAYTADVQYYLGFVAFSERQYKEALQWFEAIEKDSRYALAVPFYLAYIYHENGQDARAISYGENYLKAGDGLHNSEMLQLLASIYFNKGDQQRAVLLYEKAIANGIQLNPVQRFELGSGYHFMGKFTKAVEQLKPLSVGKDTVALQSMYILGHSYLQLNDRSSARSAFQYCISGNIGTDKKEIARFLIAKLSLEMGFEDQALQGLSNFVNDFPASTYAKEANDLLLSYYARTNNFRQALVLLERIGSFSASYKTLAPRIFFGRGIELINDLQYPAAEKMMESVGGFKNTAFYAPSLFWRGELAMRNEQFEKAIKFLQDYLKLPINPMGEANEVNALYNLGYAFFEIEDYAKAAPYFEKIYTGNRNISPDIKSEAMLRAADCAFMEKNTIKAKSIYTSVHNRKGEGADYAAFQLALIEGIKSPASKIALLKAAEQQYTTSAYLPLITMEIGDAHMSEEEFDKAIPYLKRIPSLVEKDDEMIPASLLKLGIAYYNLDKIEDAIAQYRRLVKEYPASEQAAEAIESAQSLFVDNGRIDEYQQFLEAGGRSMDQIQKDSLLFRYVQTTYADGKTQASINAMDEYLRKFPNGLFLAEVLNYKGELYIKEKDWKAAAQWYDQLASIGTSKYQEKALRVAGKLYFFELKDYSAALKQFNQLSRLTTKTDVLLESLRGEVRSYYHLKQWLQGRDVSKLLISNPAANQDDQSFGLTVLGYATQAEKMFEQSTTFFSKVLVNNQSSLAAEARHQIAMNAFKLGNWDAAEKAALSSIENSGSYEYWITRSYLLLGDIFFQQKDFFNAKATLNSLVENCSISELKLEASEKLKAVELADQIICFVYSCLCSAFCSSLTVEILLHKTTVEKKKKSALHPVSSLVS